MLFIAAQDPDPREDIVTVNSWSPSSTSSSSMSKVTHRGSMGGATGSFTENITARETGSVKSSVAPLAMRAKAHVNP